MLPCQRVKSILSGLVWLQADVYQLIFEYGGVL